MARIAVDFVLVVGANVDVGIAAASGGWPFGRNHQKRKQKGWIDQPIERLNLVPPPVVADCDIGGRRIGGKTADRASTVRDAAE